MTNSSSDPDFVVPDELSEELSDSDWESSPKLSLMDRIQRKSRTATTGKKKLAPGANDESSEPSDASKGKRPQFVHKQADSNPKEKLLANGGYFARS